MEVDLANILFSWLLHVDPANILDPANLLTNWYNKIPSWNQLLGGLGALGGGFFGGGGSGGGGSGSRPPGFPSLNDLIGAPPNLDPALGSGPLDPNFGASSQLGEPVNPDTWSQQTVPPGGSGRPDSADAVRENQRLRDQARQQPQGGSTAGPPQPTYTEQFVDFFNDVIVGGIQHKND